MVHAERVTRVQKLARLSQVTGQLRAASVRKRPTPQDDQLSDQQRDAKVKPPTSSEDRLKTAPRRPSAAADQFKLSNPMMYYVPPPYQPQVVAPYWFRPPPLPPYIPPYYTMPPPQMMMMLPPPPPPPPLQQQQYQQQQYQQQYQQQQRFQQQSGQGSGMYPNAAPSGQQLALPPLQPPPPPPAMQQRAAVASVDRSIDGCRGLSTSGGGGGAGGGGGKSQFKIINQRYVTTTTANSSGMTTARPTTTRALSDHGGASTTVTTTIKSSGEPVVTSTLQSPTTTTTSTIQTRMPTISMLAKPMMSTTGASPLLATAGMSHPQVEYSETESGVGEDDFSSSGSESVTDSQTEEIFPHTQEPPVQPVLEPMPEGIIKLPSPDMRIIQSPTTTTTTLERREPTHQYEAPTMRITPPPPPPALPPRLPPPPTPPPPPQRQPPPPPPPHHHREMEHHFEPQMIPLTQQHQLYSVASHDQQTSNYRTQQPSIQMRSAASSPPVRMAQGMQPAGGHQILKSSSPEQVQRERLQIQQQYVQSNTSYYPPAASIRDQSSSPRPLLPPPPPLMMNTGPEYYGSYGQGLTEVVSPRPGAYHSMFTPPLNGEPLRLSPLAPPASLNDEARGDHAMVSHRGQDLIPSEKHQMTSHHHQHQGEIVSSSRYSYPKPRLISKPPVVVSGGGSRRGGSLRSLTKSGRSEMTFTVERINSKKRICGC